MGLFNFFKPNDQTITLKRKFGFSSDTSKCALCGDLAEPLSESTPPTRELPSADHLEELVRDGILESRDSIYFPSYLEYALAKNHASVCAACARKHAPRLVAAYAAYKAGGPFPDLPDAPDSELVPAD